MKRGVIFSLGALTILALVLVLFSAYKWSSEPVLITNNLRTEYAYILSEGSDDLYIINTDTNEVEYKVDAGEDPIGIAFSPDNQTVYVTNGNLNIVSIINTSTNRVISKVNVGNNPAGVAVSPDGKMVYVANTYSNNVSVIDTSRNIVKYSLDVKTNPWGVAVSPDGKMVYVANHRSSIVSIIDTEARSVIEDLDLIEESPYGVAVSPDGTKVYVTHDDSDNLSVIEINNSTYNVRPVKLDTGRNKDKVKLSPLGVAVSPDGKTVYVVNHKTPIKGISDTPCGSVYVINTTTYNVTARAGVDKNPCGVAITSNGSKIYVTNSGSKTVSVIDTAKNTEIANVPVGDMPCSLGQFIGSPPNIPEKNNYKDSIYGLFIYYQRICK